MTTPNSRPVLIDWTGAGRGPRLASLAFLIFSSALEKGFWSPEHVDAVVAGYRSHIKFQESEISRLANVMRVRPLIFACWCYRHAVLTAKQPDGAEWWMPNNGLVDQIASRARTALEHSS
jgi:Ser/Thr protein kinase RdoA (MazF antagonist)